MSNEQFFNYFMERTNYISMRWLWCPLSTTPTCLVGFFKIMVHVAHWNDSLRVDMSPHSDTLSWYWANQSLLLLLMLFTIKQRSSKYQFHKFLFCLWPDWKWRFEYAEHSQFSYHLVLLWTILVLRFSNGQVPERHLQIKISLYLNKVQMRQPTTDLDTNSRTKSCWMAKKYWWVDLYR